MGNEPMELLPANKSQVSSKSQKTEPGQNQDNLHIDSRSRGPRACDTQGPRDTAEGGKSCCEPGVHIPWSMTVCESHGLLGAM